MAGKASLVMTGLIAAVIGAGAVVALGASSPDKAAIETIVREYILEHPEVLTQAMDNLQNREVAKVVAANRKAIETPFAGAWEGAADGDVVLVQFFDYACGYCRASLPDIDRLLREDKKLKVVYREMPILGQPSLDAARVSLAVAQKGNYAAFHRAVYAAGKITPASLDAARKAAGAVKGGEDAPVVQAEIAANLDLLRQLNFSGTPSWVVGDRVLNGAVGYDKLKQAIAETRAAKG